eukprot:TRINITY_DN4303_c1_g3_i1.p1 TRINITY_DN4303_c1_g3~~TRINITY_DN4303_c1_g3_i1.p1  ORF type:complete len:861 (+),score=228.71 TRINITY_DN4303_c1_g3_i1:44-2626(+)
MAAPILARQGTPVDHMAASLHSDKPSMRIWGLMQVAKMGELAAEPRLQLDVQVAALVDDPDVGVQEQALRTMSQLGSRGVRYCDLIAKKLNTGEKSVKLSALAALGSLGAGQASDVLAYLDHPDLDLAAGACKALGGMKATSAASKVAQKLDSGDAELAIAACESLSAMDREVDAIAKQLASTSARVKAAAVRALKTMTRAEDFAPPVALLVGDQDSYVRIGAAESIEAMGEKASSQAATLAKYLSNSSPGVVAAAAYALGTIGASETAALESALDIDEEDMSTRMLSTAGVQSKLPAELRKPACAAATTLGSLNSTKSAQKLVDRLNSKDWEIRAAAVNALGQLASESGRFESQILDLLKDPSPVVVAGACRALGKIAETGMASASTAAAVAELLENKQPLVRASAAAALGLMGEEAAAFLEDLSRLFSDKAWHVTVEAVKTVAGCGELGQMYAADVCRLTFQGHPAVREVAIDALTRMGERGACFAEEIEQLLGDPEVSPAVQKALEYFASAAAAGPDSLPDAPRASDAKALANGMANGSSEHTTPDTLPVGLLFPGQGSQYVKMMTEVKDLPGVKSMLATAQSILGYDVLKLCLEGPEDQLEQTKFCQPAMYIGGLAGLELLKTENAAAAAKPQAVAGLSLGEYTALTVAGVFDFETGLKLVKLRGEAMQEAAEATPQKMISVAGLDRGTLEKLCKESLSGPDDICQVANFLFPNGFSCAGSAAASDKLLEKASKTEGCLQAKPLKTSGGFHTGFMKPAREKLLAALRECEPKMKPPTCQVYMNLTGQKIEAGTPVAQIVDMLGDQLTNCVMWEPAMKAMIKDGVTEFYECGPMKQLKAMMKRIDPDAWKKTQNIHV